MSQMRELATRVIAGIVLLIVVAALQAAEKADDSPLSVYVGTYTGKESKGIYRLEFDPATGKLSNLKLAGEATNPSFLAIHPNKKFLYAVGEMGDLTYRGNKSGAVSAFAIDPTTGDLTLLNRQPSGGNGPCHIVVDRAGKNVLVANYGGGSAAVLPVSEEGRLSEPSGFVQHKGTSVNPKRQEAPHAHSINLDAANRYAFVADLGLDKVLVYKYDSKTGKIQPNDPPEFDLAPGAGPRHFAFHPSGNTAYVINELQNTITVLAYEPTDGYLKARHAISTLPANFTGTSHTAEVQVHPSGKFVYGSNRGHDSIAIFKVDPQTGELIAAGHQNHKIKVPRNFGIDPSGKYLLVCNQDSDSIVVFQIDQETGKLTPVGEPVSVPRPVCVKFLKKGQ